MRRGERARRANCCHVLGDLLLAPSCAERINHPPVAGDKGKGLGQDIAPGQSANPGQQTAPGQLGVKPSHPDNFGATASSICAHNANPQGKDDCVRLNK